MSTHVYVARLLVAFVLGLSVGLFILTACGGTPGSGSLPSAPSPTPTPVPGSFPSSNGSMARANIQGTGVYDTTPVLHQPSEIWRFKSTHGHPSSVAAIVSGTVYFGTYDGTLYALDSSSGSMRWRCWLCNDGMGSPSIAGGMLYVSSINERLYALDSKKGPISWEFSIQDPSKPAAIFSDPVVDGGVVYVGCDRNSFFALDAATGEVKWRFDASGWGSAPAIANGTLYFGGRSIDGRHDTYIYALEEASGKEKWRVPLPVQQKGSRVKASGLQDTPAVAYGMVFAATWGQGLLALDATTGQQRWQYALGSTILNAPAVAYGNVYVTNNGSLIALDATTGLEKWKQGDGGSITTTPVLAGHVVYFVSTDATGPFIPFVTQPSWGGYIYAVDAQTGEQLWRYRVNGMVHYSPAISDGVLYYGDEDDYFHALR